MQIPAESVPFTHVPRSSVIERNRELKLATSCILPQTFQRDTEIGDLLDKGIDWPKFKKIVHRHRITGLALAALAPRADLVPNEYLKDLQEVSRRECLRNLQSAVAAKAAVDALNTQEIPCVVLKGAVVAQIAYDTLSVRHAKDIDILVQEADVEQAEAVLLSMGYKRLLPGNDWTVEELRKFRELQKHYEFLHRQNGCQLELHWRMANNRHAQSLQFEFARPRQVSIREARLSLPALPQNAMFLHLCWHGYSHAWMRLKWLADIVPLLRQMSSEEFAEIEREAEIAGLGRPFRQSIRTLEAVCGIRYELQRRTSFLENSFAAASARTIANGDGQREVADSMFIPSLITLNGFMLRGGREFLSAQFRDLMTYSGFLVREDRKSIVVKRMTGWMGSRVKRLRSNV